MEMLEQNGHDYSQEDHQVNQPFILTPFSSSWLPSFAYADI